MTEILLKNIGMLENTINRPTSIPIRLHLVIIQLHQNCLLTYADQGSLFQLRTPNKVCLLLRCVAYSSLHFATIYCFPWIFILLSHITLFLFFPSSFFFLKKNYIVFPSAYKLLLSLKACQKRYKQTCIAWNSWTTWPGAKWDGVWLV